MPSWWKLALLAGVVAVSPAACADGASDGGSVEGTTTSPTTPASSTTTTTAAVTTTTAAATTVKCESVAFTPNSEDAASDITATGLSCEDARAFVRIAGRQTSSGGPPALDVEGYRCVRVATEQDPLPNSTYECTSGAKKIRFVRS